MGKSKNDNVICEIDLEGIFHFSREDLKANREGYISAHQFSVLKNTFLQKIRSFLPVLLIPCILTLPLIFIMNDARPNGLSFFAIFPMIALLMAGAMLVNISVPLYLLWQDYRDGSTEIAEGITRLNVQQIRDPINSTQYSRRYFVNIGDKDFEVSLGKFVAFKNGDPYLVYYAPHSRTILAVEWLNASPFE